jgi:protein ImuB
MAITGHSPPPPAILPSPARLQVLSPPPATAPLASARLWLAIHLPQFPLEVACRGGEAGRACVVVDGEGARQRVLMANAAAARLGVRPGLPIAAAHALGAVTVLARTPIAEARALAGLCTWAYQFTPLISVTPGEGLVLEIQGSLKLFGGIEQLGTRLRRELRELGYRGYLAAAPTPAAAMALAVARRQQAVHTLAALPGALHELPIDVLNLPPAALQDLYGIGVRTLGDCTRLPRDGLGRRVTPRLLDLLDRLYGRRPDPRVYFELPASFESRLELPWEIRHTQALQNAMSRQLHELTAYLRARDTATRQLRWTLHQADGEHREYLVGLGAPGRDFAQLSLLTRERFYRETLTAAVRALELNVTQFEQPQLSTLPDLFPGGAATEREGWPQFAARLRARLGPAALQRLELHPEHRPERASRRANAVDATLAEAQDTRVSDLQIGHRPVWLTRRPIPLHERNGRLEWRGGLALGAERERIESGWWDDEPVARDYFVATDSRGARWWVYRELTGTRKWYLHGLFE